MTTFCGTRARWAGCCASACVAGVLLAACDDSKPSALGTSDASANQAKDGAADQGDQRNARTNPLRDAGERDASGPRPLRDASDAAAPNTGLRDAAAADAAVAQSALDARAPAAPDARTPDASSALHELGFSASAVDATWETVSLSAHRWRLATVVMPANVQLDVLELGAVLSEVPTPSDGRAIRLGLWSDASDGGGRQPGTLLAYTSIGAAANGTNRLATTANLKAHLTGGTTYWVGINISQPDSKIARRQGSGDEVTFSAQFGETPWDTLRSFPDVGPSYAISDYALFIVAQDAL